MKEKVFVLLMFLCLSSLCSNAQKRFSLGVFQDIRHALFRHDDHGHVPLTIDAVVRAKYHTKGGDFGHIYYTGGFEYAELVGNFRRYSLGLGYNFEKIVIPAFWFVPRVEMKGFEFGINLNYGVIHRYDFVVGSYGFNAELSYKLLSWMKLQIVNQRIQRSDILKTMSPTDVDLDFLDMRSSWFFGVEFYL